MEQSLLANRFHFWVRRELFLNPEPLQTSECREIDLRPPTLPGVALLILGSLCGLFREEKNPLWICLGGELTAWLLVVLSTEWGGGITGGHFVP